MRRPVRPTVLVAAGERIPERTETRRSRACRTQASATAVSARRHYSSYPMATCWGREAAIIVEHIVPYGQQCAIWNDVFHNARLGSQGHQDTDMKTIRKRRTQAEPIVDRR